MQKIRSDVVLEVSETGVQQIRVYANDDREREAALRLLVRVGPQIRALETALGKEPTR